MAAKTKILFVDDEPAYCKWFLREMRSEKAFLIETAADGLEALEKLKSFPADVVMTDLIMPNMDGLELLEKIRKTRPDVLAMVVTGSVNIDNAIQAMKLGAYDYILKPFDSDIFKQAIKKAARHKHLQHEFRVVHEKVDLLGKLVNKAGAVMVFAVDCDGHILEVNSLAVKTFGFTKADLLSRNMDELFALNGGKIWGAVAKSITLRSHWQGELDAVRHNGTTLPVHMTAGRSESEKDHSAHTICFVRDISLEKEMNQMKLEFISVASHELRTPLTSAKNAVDLIMAGKTGAMNEKQTQFLSLAKRNIDRMVGLMNNLYDIYEIESGNIAFHFEKMDVKDCINSAVNALKPMADGKSLTLNVIVPSGIPAVYADFHRIKEVMLNLVGNAINFSPQKGRVTIEAREVVGAGGIVEINVTDSSIDILDEFVVLVFEKLYQADSSLSAKDRAGAGLSLAISRYTIEAHGGKLSWLSKKGEGNTFRFTLPVC